MTHEDQGTTRREFLKTTSRMAAASALAGAAVGHVHAAENNTIQVALIGCGGRGNGAAVNALSVDNGPIKLVAMADMLRRKLECRPEEPEEGTGREIREEGRRAQRAPVRGLRRV